MRFRRAHIQSGAVGLLIALFHLGCGDALEQSRSPMIRHHQEVRPTSPVSRVRYPEDSDVFSHTTEGSRLKVWWVEQGIHAPPLEDSDNNDIPDYVEQVLGVAANVRSHFEEAGFKTPIVDKEYLSNPDEYGQDAKFDIYLQNFEGSDGQFGTDNCRNVGANQFLRCTGHIRLENDFHGSSYPTTKEGMRVVISHEYFHAIANAYNADLPAWISEGAATWAEEFFYADQQDFEYLANLYFDEPDRSLTSPGFGPTDGWPYATSIFFYYLSQQFSPDFIQKLFVEFGKGKTFAPALRDVVSSKDVSFKEALRDFFAWNGFTGSRSRDNFGYPNADRFKQMPVIPLRADKPLNWNTSADTLTANYARLELDTTMRLKLASQGTYDRLSVVARPLQSPSEEFVPLKTEFTKLSADQSPYLLVASNLTLEEERAIQVQVRNTQTQNPPKDTEEKNANSGSGSAENDRGSSSSRNSKGGGCHTSSSPTPLSLSSLFALILLTRTMGGRQCRG